LARMYIRSPDVRSRSLLCVSSLDLLEAGFTLDTCSSGQARPKLHIPVALWNEHGHSKGQSSSPQNTTSFDPIPFRSPALLSCQPPSRANLLLHNARSQVSKTRHQTCCRAKPLNPHSFVDSTATPSTHLLLGTARRTGRAGGHRRFARASSIWTKQRESGDNPCRFLNVYAYQGLNFRAMTWRT
jgi:hypothetical protein